MKKQKMMICELGKRCNGKAAKEGKCKHMEKHKSHWTCHSDICGSKCIPVEEVKK